MSFTAKDLAHAQVMILQAEIVKGALTKLFESAKQLQASSKDKPLSHQVIKQALASAGINKIVDATDELQKNFLATFDRKGGPIITEAIGIDNFLVPSYTYTPSSKAAAKLTNTDAKTNGDDFLMVLRAIVACKEPGAVEKRLVAGVFSKEITGQRLLEACGGLVELKQEDDWSVKKTS